MPALTPQQQEILDSIGKNTTVSAGAGAGKTRVMVERYLEIIRRSRDGSLPEELRAGVANVLTITFTEDAASELKSRLVQRLTEEGMIEERRQVETAYISTIHGFCSRLLKENPFEAGLDPQFGVAVPAENTLLQEAAFEGIVEEGFAKGWPEVVGLFEAFSTARRFGDSSIDPLSLLRRESSALCDILRSQGWNRGDLEKWIDRGLEGILDANQTRISVYLNELLESIVSLIEPMARMPLGTECAMETARLEMLGSLPDLQPLSPPTASLGHPNITIDCPPAGALASSAEKCARLLELRKLAGKTSTRKGADPAAVDQLKERFRAIADRIDARKKLLASFNASLEEKSSQQAYWLLQITQRLWQRHEALKRRGGLLDFNDLQSFARDLLTESPSVLDRYRRRLRHLMVDEFQDTDSLQKQILDLLRGDRNLFCVGDPKQSIYGFRNADVTIFRDLIETIRDADPNCNTHLSLRGNFRCRPEIIHLVNHVFSTMGVGTGIEYEPLESEASFRPREDPSLELLLASNNEEPEGEAAGAKKALEAELVAKRIRQMLDESKVQITACGDREREPLQPRDFLILLRTFSRLSDYEKALENQGIDYYIVGGRGYYALREIRDIVNILQVIRNPLKDVALAATLRSPFCGLSDEALYALARLGQQEAGRSLYSGVLAALSQPPPAPSGPPNGAALDLAASALDVAASALNVAASALQQSGSVNKDISNSPPQNSIIREPGHDDLEFPASPSSASSPPSPSSPPSDNPQAPSPIDHRPFGEAAIHPSTHENVSPLTAPVTQSADFPISQFPSFPKTQESDNPTTQRPNDPSPFSLPPSPLSLPPRDLQRLAPFWALIERMRRKEDRTPVASILEELLSETLYEARILMEYGGRRKMANVRKLVTSASQQNACGVSEFLHWLNQQSRVELKEGEAPTEEEASNVVRIRTIHNAKGLESNIVIVGGLSQNMLGPAFLKPAFYFDICTGAGGCQFPSPDSFKSQQSAVYTLLSQEQESRELDESLRLLYVAMTRAREYLILAGSYPCKGNTWLNRLLPAIALRTRPESDEVHLIAPGLEMVVRPKVAGHRQQTPAAKTLMESIQATIRAGQPLDPAELENLRNLTRS